MENLGVNLQDYQNTDLVNQVLFGNANATQEQINDLAKALEARDITGQSTLNLTTASGAPLKVESLDKSLKLITFRESDIVLWKKVPKLPAYNTVEEYNQLISYGADRGGFNVEGELPNEEDSQYVRRSQMVKYLGVTKSVTHPMTLVNTMIGNVIDREVKHGTLWILRKLNRALTKGNLDIIPEEFDGLYNQQFKAFNSINDYMDSTSVIDLRGASLSEGDIENGAESIIENFGQGTDFFAPPKIISDFVKFFYAKKFISPNTSEVSNAIMGQRVTALETTYGKINLNYDIFMNKEVTKAFNSAATSPLAPSVITPVALTPVAPAVANSKWATTDAGTYYYAVVPINRFGEGALTVMNPMAIATVLAGGAIDLQFTAAGGANPATGFTIYRSNKAPASLASAIFYPLFSVSTTNLSAGYDGAAAGSIRDNNRFMPNTNQAFLIQNDEECYAFRQLAPLMKMDLAVISPAYRFAILLYGTELLFAPKKMVRYINVG
ncbi:MAG TPA: hypothetical protein PKY56_00150 [Candidatus Kapabacteria bacterium]|nr:hypothetical protein [Candidatus Kapabacteria bacterium]